MRTKVYVDCYNLYYGCLKGTGYKWLDLHKLFSDHILPSSAPPPAADLIGIKFFTAPIKDQASSADDSVACQSKYHRALGLLRPNEIEVVQGYYAMTQTKAKIVDAENPKKWPRDCQEILVWKLEEKQSDVSLALHAYHDAMTGQVDQVVIVTNDTDIAPALQMIRKFTNVRIGLVIPTRDGVRIPNTALDAQAHWVRSHITDEELSKSQMPRVVPGARKPAIKPDGW